MIFVGGIHGVGKTSFCQKAKQMLNIEVYSSSELISQEKNMSFSKNKYATNIESNQSYLLNAVKKINLSRKKYILDGHFCLLDYNGLITHIDANTFVALKPEAIILLTEDPDVVALRRKERDGIEQSTNVVKSFQDEEIRYAKEVAKLLKIKLWISSGENDLELTLKFIEDILGGEYGRKI